MNAPHLIERLDVEIEFDPPDPELHAEQPLLRLLKETLLPVLEEVLDACDEPGTVLVLPALDLDLGTIERQAWATQAPARLRALLEDAIAAARQQARLALPGSADLPQIRSTGTDTLARLAAFLRSGRLGWDAQPGRADLHVVLLDGLLATERAALLRMLADTARQPMALRRLAEQFPRHQLESILGAAAPQVTTPAAWAQVLGAALEADAVAPAERERLAAWWRRGERDAGAQDLLERLLARGGAHEDAVRRALAQLLGSALSTPDGARRLAAALPLRLRERLLRFLAPGAGPRMLALASEVERQLVGRVGDRGRAAEAHARCWQVLLATGLGALGGVVREDLLRARLYALVDAAAQGAALPAADEAQPSPDTVVGPLQAGLEAWWRTGRIDAARAIHLEHLLARAGRSGVDGLLRPALAAALARTLAAPDGALLLARALPERLREALLWFALPDMAPRVIDVLHRLRAKSGGAGIDAWARVLAASLAPAASAATVQTLCERLDPAAAGLAELDQLESWWRSGHADAARAGRLERLLARATAAGADGAPTRALAAALARTVALPEGPRRLAAAIPEQVGIALLWCLAPALAPRLVALMHDLRRRLASRPGIYRDCWAQVYALCFSPSPSAAAVDALCRRLDAAAPQGTAAQDTADGVAVEPIGAALDALEAWWRAGQPDPGRAALLERLLGDDPSDPPGALGESARAALRAGLAAAVRRTLASPGGARRLVSAIPEHLREALLARLAPGFAPAVVVRLRALGRWLVSTPAAVGPAPGLHAICWAEVLAACLSPTVTAASVQALCARLDGLLAPAAPVGTATGVERLAVFLRRGRLLGAVDGENHVALLDTLLARSSLQPLWRMLAGALRRPAETHRLVEQFPERQLREVVARAAPAQAEGLLALADEWQTADAAAGLAPRRRRQHVWPMLLGAAVRAAAGLAPFPGMQALRRALLERCARPAPASVRWQPGIEEGGATRALKRLLSEAALVRTGTVGGLAQEAPPALAARTPDRAARRVLDECAALAAGIGASDGAQWLARIRNHLARDGRMTPARQAVMVDAIEAAAASTDGSKQAFLRLALDRLRRGATLDLEAIAGAASADEAAEHAPVAPDGPRGALVAALLAAEGDPPPPAWRALLETRRDDVLRVLHTAGRRRAWRAALRDGLPQRMLADLVELARPDLAAAVRGMAERSKAIAGVLGSAWQHTLWRAAFGLAVRPGQPAASDRASACEQVLRAAAPGAADQAALLEAWTRPAMPAPGKGGSQDDEPVVQPGERIALGNAGMVLMAPYLPRLFGMLGLVADGAFIDRDAAERAVHLLQFAVSGESSTPEYALPLNKLLCGLALDAPVAAGIDLTVAERETIEGLLEALIAAWSALGRTSIEGLRQSFLMRGGELALGPQGWELTVAHGPFDMLMDRLPWSFSIVRFGWMPTPLHVTWH